MVTFFLQNTEHSSLQKMKGYKLKLGNVVMWQ